MKKITLPIFILSALFSTLTVKAQKKDSVSTRNWFNRNIAGAMQIQLTYRKGDIGQLDGALISNGIGELSESDLWINASMSHIHGNWISEDGIGFTPVASSNNNNGIYAKYNQYQAYFREGYNLSANPAFRFYPFIGINFSASVLNIQDNNGIQSTSNFTNELLNSTASKTFYQPNFGIEAGLGYDFLIKVKPKTTDCLTINRNIPIGIRAGYYFNTYASDWKINSYALQDSPNQKQSAVFLSFNIGLGYEIKKD